MRTKDEIVTYLKENGHTANAIAKITGFLIGANIKEVKEGIVFKRGDGTWDEFFMWYKNEPKQTEEYPLYNIFAYLHKLRNETDNAAEISRIDDCIMFLVDTFVLDATNYGDLFIMRTTTKPCEKENKSHL